MTFPKRNDSVKKGATGQSFFQYFVNDELECVYHPINQENDFGIDGYIELVVDHCVSGKLVGVQLKHGSSFFKAPTSYGYKYVGDNKHLNYYLNSQSPIFIVIMDECFDKMHWVKFDIAKTLPLNDNNWWIEIPSDNQLKTNFKQAIFESSTPIIDFDKQIQFNWGINAALQNYDYRVIAIPKSEIVSQSFSFVNEFMERLSANKKFLIESRSSLDIFFPEYDDDPCEIFQIPEIMMWLQKSIDIGIPWFYFLNTKGKNTGLHLLVHSYCSPVTITSSPVEIMKNRRGYLVNYSGSDLGHFLEKNFINMNCFMEKHNIGLEINKEISSGITEYFHRCLI